MFESAYHIIQMKGSNFPRIKVSKEEQQYKHQKTDEEGNFFSDSTAAVYIIQVSYQLPTTCRPSASHPDFPARTTVDQLQEDLLSDQIASNVYRTMGNHHFSRVNKL